MILIDAIYIHIGGPKILLDYLITSLEKTDKKVTYLLDERVRGKIKEVKSETKIIYQKPKLALRRKFYTANKNSFSTVLCMNNLPPNIRLKATVYTYFHNLPFLQSIPSFSFQKNILFSLKRMILSNYKRNTDFWIVQTGLIGKQLSQKYNLLPQQMLNLPFYEPLKNTSTEVEKIKDQYIYVSLGLPYKNHLRLIDAFCHFYDKHQYGKLIITLPNEYKRILQLVENKRNEGYPIQNVGYVERENIQQLFHQSTYHIFPSLAESLGLGIIESIECNCKVIGADLPYMHAVCVPSIVFDPLNTSAIIDALEQSLGDAVPPSINKVENQMQALLDLLY